MAAPRTPPRFVPTLTEVIEAGPDVVSDAPALAALPALPALPALSVAAVSDPSRAMAIGPAPLSDAEMLGVDEHLVQRVLERVDRLLEDRLSDAVASVVQAQLDAMIPSLRAEIEGALRTLVAESMAAELSEHQGSAPFSPL